MVDFKVVPPSFSKNDETPTGARGHNPSKNRSPAAPAAKSQPKKGGQSGKAAPKQAKGKGKGREKSSGSSPRRAGAKGLDRGGGHAKGGQKHSTNKKSSNVRDGGKGNSKGFKNGGKGAR